MVWEVTPRACKLGALRYSNMQCVGYRVSTDGQTLFLSDNLRMTTLNPEQQEAANAQVVYDKAQMLAFYFSEPQDVSAATAAILQAAFIMATADLSAERRASMFMENK